MSRTSPVELPSEANVTALDEKLAWRIALRASTGLDDCVMSTVCGSFQPNSRCSIS